jgi:hypothetical protein
MMELLETDGNPVFTVIVVLALRPHPSCPMPIVCDLLQFAQVFSFEIANSTKSGKKLRL